MRLIRKFAKSAGPEVKFFEGGIPLDLNYKVESKSALKNETGEVEDYRGVQFSGYASTWGNVDRDGEVMVRGAFQESLKSFRRNPVLQRDHKNTESANCGHFTEIREDEKGLFVRAAISDAPDCINTRFKLMEGSLRALSVAGAMRFDEGGRNIVQVFLWEVSIVAVPANPEALIEATLKIRDFTDADLKRFNLENTDNLPRAAQRPAPRRADGIFLPFANLVIT